MFEEENVSMLIVIALLEQLFLGYTLVKFLASLSFNCKDICISKIWRSSEHNNDLFKLPNYRVRKDLSTNSEDIEVLCIEIIKAKSKNTVVNTS